MLLPLSRSLRRLDPLLPHVARRPLLLAIVLATLAGACGDRAPSDAPLDAARCTTLRANAPGDTRIDTAEWVADGVVQAAGSAVPAFCRLVGMIGARTGVRGVPYGIGFELRLPAAWNGRFYFQGGTGTDGVIAAPLGTFAGGSALGLGYAVVSTDAGHQGFGPEFGLDPDARVDFGHRAIERVTLRATDVIRSAYGRAPERSYFVGCSNGGRQGFVASQRYPELFDGIVAGAPGFDLPRAAIGEAWNTQAVAAIATTRDANGHPYLPDTFSDADLALLSRAVLDACDANDGLADGIVDDLPGCRFDPAIVQCGREQTADCLGAAQVGALAKIFGGAHDSSGNALYSDFPWDGGIGDPSPIGSLRAWTLGSPASPANTALNVTLGAGALAFVFTTPPVETADPLAFVLGYDFDRDPRKILASDATYTQSAVELMTATSSDLSRFRSRGGKLLVYHGASDGVFSVNDTIRWYERLDAAEGGRAAEYARLFVVPGMGHCAGGPATDSFAAFPALVSWVENGVAPDSLLARASAASPFPGRTRPLCPWPSQTRYSGAGDVDDAASFACR